MGDQGVVIFSLRSRGGKVVVVSLARLTFKHVVVVAVVVDEVGWWNGVG